MTQVGLHAVLLLVLSSICSCDASVLCFNQTKHTVPGLQKDYTQFDGSTETISCEDGFGCSKTHIKKDGVLLGVTRGCGIHACAGRAVFKLDGFRLYTHCCQASLCNRACAVNSDLLVFTISLATGWLIGKQ